MTRATAQSKLLEPFQDPAAVLDAQGKVLSWNEGFARLGLTEKQLPDGFTLTQFGPSASEAFAATQRGVVSETRLITQTASAPEEENENSRREWHAVFIPQVEAQTILVLQDIEIDLAYHDVITGLPNRRAASERLSLDWERMVRSTRYNFSLVITDIDNFKRINDRLGHHVGDQVLNFVGTQLKAALRGGDWVARWGGEEFVIMLHNIGLPMAETVTDRIRDKIASKSFTSDEGIATKVRLSMGVADCADFREEAQSNGSTYLDIVNEAEILMYDAKLAGRNRVVAATPGEKAYWNHNALIRTLADDSLTVSGRPVQDSSGKQAGVIWTSLVRETSARGTQHLRRSALQHGQSSRCDSTWLRAAARQIDPAQTGKLAFVQISANSLMQMHSVRALSDAISAVSAAGAQPVLVVNDQPYLIDLPAATIDELKHLGCSLCLRLTSLDNLPTGLFNALKPSYIYVEMEVLPKDDMLSEVLNILDEYGSNLLLPAQSRLPGSAHSNWLVIGTAAS